MQLQDALGQFQVQLAADGRSIHTRKQYERHCRSLIAWLTKTKRPTTLARISPHAVAEFFGSDAAKASARGGAKKATSANAQRTSLRNFFRWAHESGLVSANAARLLKRARCAPAPPKALRPDEVERLHAVLGTATGAEAERDRMLIEVLLGCGARIGSVLAIDVPDIDFAHNEIMLRRQKNDRPATVVMPNAVAVKLKAFVAGRTDGPLFLAHGNRVSMRHAQRRITGWFAKSRIVGKSCHSCRHFFAASLLARTGDIRLVQLAMHHASIISTTIYAQVDAARVRAAVGN